MRDEFEAEDFCTTVFDEFFFASIQHENTVRNLLRLLWVVHPKVSPTRLENLMKLAEPTGHGTLEQTLDPMTKMYTELKEKVDGHLSALAKSQSEEEALKGSAENLI